MPLREGSKDQRQSLSLRGFEDTRLVAFPVTILDTGALIVCFLALGDTEFQLRSATTPVGSQRNQGEALAFHQAHQAIDFVTVS